MKARYHNRKALCLRMFFGPPGRIRTYDLPLRRGLLYPSELRVDVVLMKANASQLFQNHYVILKNVLCTLIITARHAGILVV